MLKYIDLEVVIKRISNFLFYGVGKWPGAKYGTKRTTEASVTVVRQKIY